jgi:hypothetical protein
VNLKGLGAKTNWLELNRQSLSNPDSELSQLRVAVVRSEKLVAEAEEISGTQRKGNVRRWKPLPGNGYWRLRRLYVYCSYSDFCSV